MALDAVSVQSLEKVDRPVEAVPLEGGVDIFAAYCPQIENRTLLAMSGLLEAEALANGKNNDKPPSLEGLLPALFT